MSSDRSLVVLASSDGTLVLYPASCLTSTSTAAKAAPPHQTLTDATTTLTCCEFSPDGTHIVACDNKGRAYLFCRTDIRRLRQEKRDEDLRRGKNLVRVESGGDDVDGSYVDVDDSYGDDSYEEHSPLGNDYHATNQHTQGSSSTPLVNHFPSPEKLSPLGFHANKKVHPQQQLSEFEKMRIEMMELLQTESSPVQSSGAATTKPAAEMTPVAGTINTRTTSSNSPDLSPISVVRSPRSPSEGQSGSSPSSLIPAPSTSVTTSMSSPRTSAAPDLVLSNEDGVEGAAEGESREKEEAKKETEEAKETLPFYMLDVMRNFGDGGDSDGGGGSGSGSRSSTTFSCYQCRFSPSGKHVCVTTSSNFYVWDLQRRNVDGGVVRIVGHKGEVLACSWSTDVNDDTLVTGSADHDLSLWKFDAGFHPKNSDEKGGHGWRHEWAFQGHSGPVNSVAWGNGNGGSGSGGGGGSSSSSSSSRGPTWGGGGSLLSPFAREEVGGLVSAREDAKSGPYVVSSSWDGTVRVWCCRTMCELSCSVVVPPAMVEQSFVRIRSVDACPYDRHLFVVACDNGAASVWNAHLQKQVASLLPAGSGQGKAWQCSWGVPGGGGGGGGGGDGGGGNTLPPLILCGTNRSLLCWDGHQVLPEMKKIKYLYGRSIDATEDALVKVTDVLYSPNGKSIVTSGSDGLLRIFDALDGELVWYHQPFDDDIEVCSIALDATNQQRLVCGSEDGQLAHWVWDDNLRTRAKGTATLFPAHDEAVICIAFSFDGRVLCTGSWDCTCVVWSASKMFQLASGGGGGGGGGAGTTMTPIVDVRSFPLVCIIEQFQGWVKCMDVFGGVRSGSLVVGIDDGAVHSYTFASLFDVEDVVRCVDVANSTSDSTSDSTSASSAAATPKRMECGAPLYNHQGAVNSVRYGMSGDLIASCSDDTTIHVYSTLGRTLRYTIDEECGRDAVNTVHWGGGSEQNILYVGTADRLIRIFNGKNRDLLCTLGGHEDEVTMVVAEPKGSQFVTGSADGTMRFWSIDVAALQ